MIAQVCLYACSEEQRAVAVPLNSYRVARRLKRMELTKMMSSVAFEALYYPKLFCLRDM